MRDSLIQAELCWRDQDSKNCFKTYLSVAEIFEHLNDWETASYFHKRCLDISIEFKYIEGEAKSYKGLGICQEQVLNKEEAMEHLQTGLEKAEEGQLANIQKDISRNLVRVYQQIAIEYQD